jgi:hypothetical protein
MCSIDNLLASTLSLTLSGAKILVITFSYSSFHALDGNLDIYEFYSFPIKNSVFYFLLI